MLTFVVGGLSPLEKARNTPLVGTSGVVFDEVYLAGLGLSRSQVVIKTVEDVLDPTGIVTLGKLARLAFPAAPNLPHPTAFEKAQANSKAQIIRKLYSFNVPEIAETTQLDVNTIEKAKPDELQVVTGVVLCPYNIDADNDWIPPHEIEKTAYHYLENSSVVGLKHKEKARATVVESFLVPYPDGERAKAVLNKDHTAYAYPYGNTTVYSGSWILGVRLGDDLWRLHKAGELNAFSIGGVGKRKKVDIGRIPVVNFIPPCKECSPNLVPSSL